MNINEKTKNILKIAGIYYLISATIFMALFSAFSFIKGETSGEELKIILNGLVILPVIVPIVIGIIFSPAIALLYFLFKKIKGLKRRIFLTAFIIPFTNMIYYCIAYLFSQKAAVFLGIVATYILLIFIPLLLIIRLCIPQKLFGYKKRTIVMLILMSILGFSLSTLSFSFTKFVDGCKVNLKLKKYDSVINSIEKYKKEHDEYPVYQEDEIGKFNNFVYSARNDGKDYVLKLENNHKEFYSYCSSDNFEGCKAGEDEYYIYTQYGKWIKATLKY